MMPPEVQEIIAPCFLFQNLSAAESAAVLDHGRLHKVTQGHIFFRQGEDAAMLYILVAGRVKLSQVTTDGHQIIVNYFGPGDELGIIVALSNIPYPLTAEAIEDGTAVAWHRDTMKQLLQTYPLMALNVIEMIGGRFARLQRRFQEVATQRVEQRVARAILRLVRQFGRRIDAGVILEIALTREELAQMTGTNLYNVSRILSKWEQAGFINTNRKQIILSKAHELVAIAEDLPRSQ